MQKTNAKFKPGDVVEVIMDKSIGIVTSANGPYLHVLFEDYKCLPIKKDLARKTGRYFDLKIIWEMVKDGDQISGT